MRMRVSIFTPKAFSIRSAMGLDVYTWLAQRLHRVHPGKPALIPWVSLQEQFGVGYKRIRDFRRAVLITLKQVQVVCREARFTTDGKGMHLLHSRPAHPAQVGIPNLADGTKAIPPVDRATFHGHFVAHSTATLSRKPIVKIPIDNPIVELSHLWKASFPNRCLAPMMQR